MKFSPDGRFLAIGAENGSTKPPGSPFHHDNGLLGLYAVEDQTLRKIAQVPTGAWIEGIAFSRDGKTVLVQDMQDHTIEVFRWDGKKLTQGAVLLIKGAGPESFATAWP